MCIVVPRVERISKTCIFARASESGGQYLAYRMSFEAMSDIALILPLPVPRDSPKHAVRFIDLKGYPDFFLHLQRAFPEFQPEPLNHDLGVPEERPRLKVVDVGRFEASFIPSASDFSRLDERFRIPQDVWKKLPTYRDWGFAVFKLRHGETSVHPIAFEFPRRPRSKLYFPTVHIHDGAVHETAEFDHALYCQRLAHENLDGWAESDDGAWIVDVEKTRGMVMRGYPLYRRGLNGRRPNADVLV